MDVTKREFPDRWVVQAKKLPWERYGYFLEQHIPVLRNSKNIFRKRFVSQIHNYDSNEQAENYRNKK